MEPELNTELRPCPFCGNKNPQRYRTVDLADNEQYNVYCLCFHGETLHWKPWQDAYCWREIDSLKFQLKERDEKIAEQQAELNRFCDFCGGKHKKDACPVNRLLPGWAKQEVCEIIERHKSYSVGGQCDLNALEDDMKDSFCQQTAKTEEVLAENAALKQRVGELETDNRNANNAYKEIETLFEVRTTELESQQRQDNALILELKAKLAEAEKALERISGAQCIANHMGATCPGCVVCIARKALAKICSTENGGGK